VDSVRSELARFVDGVNLALQEHLNTKREYLKEAERMLESLFSRRAMRTVIKMWPYHGPRPYILQPPDFGSVRGSLDSARSALAGCQLDTGLLQTIALVNSELPNDTE
jgi:hypothetical protein